MTFNFNGTEIYYKDMGQGTPLVLINGIMMSTASWSMFEPAFSERNRLILFDLIDQGRSGKAGGDFPISVQAEVVKALLDHLRIDSACILGISYGGETALQFAVKYPEYVKKLLLFNTVSHTSLFLQETGRAWNLAAHDPGAYYSTTIPVIYSPLFFEKNYSWMQKRKKLLTGTVFADRAFLCSMERLTNSANSHDVRMELKNITAPTLVVGCTHDFLTPLFEQEFLHSQIEESEFVIIPNCGHASMYEKPELFASLVLGFVELPRIESLI